MAKIRQVIPREIIEAIIDRWTRGEGMRALIIEYGYSIGAVYDAIWDDASLTESHARAKKIRAEMSVDDLIDIADTEPDPNKANVRINTRKWVASKYNSQAYGDKLDVTVNQTVDIGYALKEAKQRALTQPIDITPINTGLEPVTLIASNENESDDDIFL